MFEVNTKIEYVFGLILSCGKKSFENLGRFFKKSGDTINRYLQSSKETNKFLYASAQKQFCNQKKLVLAIDDTLISKNHSSSMRGACRFYDNVNGKMVTAYKLLVAALNDGRYTMPLACDFLFSKEFYEDAKERKANMVKTIIRETKELFPGKIITVVMDGAFATKELFLWSLSSNIRVETRMHSNRVVLYNKQKIALKKIKSLRPKGRQMSRTIKVFWHDMNLYITAHRRINRHGEESIVYQASTYQDKPSNHVKNYKKRWGIEKMFRTTKQHLGLKDCYSRKINKQLDHMTTVFFACSLAELKRKKGKFKTPEEAIRAFKTKKVNSAKHLKQSFRQIFGGAHA
jgi:hypothetical protein